MDDAKRVLPKGVATIAQLYEFDVLIDARTPAEFAEDHIPGALNCPVLSNEQRAEVGTIYRQISAFEAKKIGASWMARNIADHLERLFRDKPKRWRPLVYCWRGGQRSGAFTHILREVGWDAHRLEGGYKAWRRHVLAELAQLPARFSFRVIAGATGSGKSRLLEILASLGEQVLHLEALAGHKGSVLGILPDSPQPAQRWFETQIYQTLKGFDARRPVFVEAESRKIGRLEVPSALIAAIRASPCLCIEAPRSARAAFLISDYAYFLERPEWLSAQLGHLLPLVGHETIASWRALIAAGDFQRLVLELLERHYDPLYRRSQEKHFQFDQARLYAVGDLEQPTLRELAERISQEAGAAFLADRAARTSAV
ncbi:MAG: tRNA 2-selenouridine(34) synthase MnmH [Rhodocyclaceae bacterium]|nr:tRNA 2-selenouridine(34) synthase MnmH [Rhodocyclaceae bacterium]